MRPGAQISLLPGPPRADHYRVTSLRVLCVAVLALACASLAPPAATAKDRTLRPISAKRGKVVYKTSVSMSRVQRAWLRGKGRKLRLRVKTVRKSKRRSRISIRLTRSTRRRVGRRPKLVLRIKRKRAFAGTAALLDLIPPEPSPISTRCTRYAAPTGNDKAAGSASAPFRSAQKLADSLRSGHVGCLAKGTYAQPILALRNSGIVLRSRPGQRALVKGQIWVADGANRVTVAHLDHDATHLTPEVEPSPVVNGDDSLFYDLDVWSRDGVCFYIGDREWGVAERTTLRRNRIHNCGQPGMNKRHGIYLAQGVDTVIEQNWIYDNPDRGIQLYPNSQRARIRGNVIDGNGEGVIFSGDYGYASSGNVVEGNLITNSRLRHDVEAWYPEGNPVGHSNALRRNCVAGGRFGGIESPQRGFAPSSNFTSAPGYSNRSARDWRISASSGCVKTLRSASVLR
jgi:hypothetical protein